MLRSLYSGISGLHAHQMMMDVTGNNIANVNTVGYKASVVQFQDTLSQMLGSAGAPQNGQGGSNPAQVGLGVKSGGITANFAEGSQQTTGRSGDMMIAGDGFFITRQGGEMMYTRAGQFTFDANGLLVNAVGQPVQGWTAANGIVNPAGKPDDIRMPLGSTIAPKATASVTLKGNLSSDVTPDVNNPLNTGFGAAGAIPDTVPPATVTGYETTIPIKVYDSQGGTHTVTGRFHRTAMDSTVTPATSTWQVDMMDDKGALVGTQTMAFAGGKPVDSSGAPMTSMSIGTAPNAYTVDITDITSYSGLSDARVFDTDGQASGALTSVSYSVSDSGQIIGVYSNGLKETLGQVAMATFKNVNGLEKVGDSEFRSSVNSGYAQVGTPGSAGMGSVISGALEMSNVDLSQEFTNLIIAQRGFQANSKVITTSDEILQDLVAMKR